MDELYFTFSLIVSMQRGLLPCTSKQLNLDVVLANGQSFRWKRRADGSFFGVARRFAWRVWRENEKSVGYETLASFSGKNGTISTKAHDVLKDYFQLNVDVEMLYEWWSRQDAYFRQQLDSSPELLSGIRILKQDVVETLFAFICSANNNIARISGLVDKLCTFYGTKAPALIEENGNNMEFYDFPTLPQLCDGLPGMEERLRQSGFGYRAKYIADTVRKLDGMPDGGLTWLEGLRSKSYAAARVELMTLPGVGPKVADCICLMGLQKDHVVPVDTHVFQITLAQYSADVASLKNGKRNKTLSRGMHEEIGMFYAERFGSYAGWAHSVLFSNRLRHFKPPTAANKKRRL